MLSVFFTCSIHRARNVVDSTSQKTVPLAAAGTLNCSCRRSRKNAMLLPGDRVRRTVGRRFPLVAGRSFLVAEPVDPLREVGPSSSRRRKHVPAAGRGSKPPPCRPLRMKTAMASE